MKLIDQLTSTSKINLYLDVIGKDPQDGYHYIRSIFYEIPWGDDFEIYQSSSDQIVFENFAEDLSKESTVSKALCLFKTKYSITDCFFIKIKKNVPAKSGLGGGSGDAGTLLKWLSSRYQIPILECLDIAQKVGSDVPFFLYGGMALVEGKGEKVTPIKNRLAKEIGMLIISPPITVSTKEAFKIFKKGNYRHKRELDENIFLKNLTWDIDILKDIIYNIFNERLNEINQELFYQYEELKSLLLPDLIWMTGSGSSFVLLYKEKEKILQLQKKMEQTDKYSKYLIQYI